MTDLRHYIDEFSHLHTARVKGHRAPHKAVLLLAIIDHVEEKEILAPRIELTDKLEKTFNAVWSRYLGTSSIFTPDITKPYFHMQHEKFWRLVEHEEANMMPCGELVESMVAEDSSWVESKKETKDLPQGSYSVKAMRNAFAYAEIDNRLFMLLQNNDARAMLRVALINEYLTNQPTMASTSSPTKMPNITQLIAVIPLLAFVT